MVNLDTNYYYYCYYLITALERLCMSTYPTEAFLVLTVRCATVEDPTFLPGAGWNPPAALEFLFASICCCCCCFSEAKNKGRLQRVRTHRDNLLMPQGVYVHSALACQAVLPGSNCMDDTLPWLRRLCAPASDIKIRHCCVLRH